MSNRSKKLTIIFFINTEIHKNYLLYVWYYNVVTELVNTVFLFLDTFKGQTEF